MVPQSCRLSPRLLPRGSRPCAQGHVTQPGESPALSPPFFGFTDGLPGLYWQAMAPEHHVRLSHSISGSATACELNSCSYSVCSCSLSSTDPQHRILVWVMLGLLGHGLALVLGSASSRHKLLCFHFLAQPKRTTEDLAVLPSAVSPACPQGGVCHHHCVSAPGLVACLCLSPCTEQTPDLWLMM